MSQEHRGDDVSCSCISCGGKPPMLDDGKVEGATQVLRMEVAIGPPAFSPGLEARMNDKGRKPFRSPALEARFDNSNIDPVLLALSAPAKVEVAWKDEMLQADQEKEEGLGEGLAGEKQDVKGKGKEKVGATDEEVLSVTSKDHEKHDEDVNENGSEEHHQDFEKFYDEGYQEDGKVKYAVYYEDDDDSRSMVYYE